MRTLEKNERVINLRILLNWSHTTKVIKGCSRLSWLRMGTNDVSSRILYSTLSFHDAGISWPTEQLLINNQLLIFNIILIKKSATCFMWVMMSSILRLYSVELLPITMTARSEAWTVFARSNTENVLSNSTRGTDVCACVVLCVGSGLATCWSPIQGVLTTVYRIKKLKKRPRSNKGL
jgi:hypothetical protein